MKILTWNMQGYDGVGDKTSLLSGWLNTGEYDVVCVQEATRPLGSFEHIGDINGISVWRMPRPYNPPRGVTHIYDYTAFYYPWGNANLRCSLVTYMKNFDDIRDNCGVYYNPQNLDARQMLYVFHNGSYIVYRKCPFNFRVSTYCNSTIL